VVQVKAEVVHLELPAKPGGIESQAQGGGGLLQRRYLLGGGRITGGIGEPHITIRLGAKGRYRKHRDKNSHEDETVLFYHRKNRFGLVMSDE
jgi:hypothetical protein